ncbi:glycoside hydrolase [Pluteus cervinus]|uniref:Glycoside hydrolase n=1 Tax=Pluteus cervinus TaxID=181527 RepID=A0ACD3B039_9AGAR|nr:glycoside hydrolase [Pluteus cervinus]
MLWIRKLAPLALLFSFAKASTIPGALVARNNTGGSNSTFVTTHDGKFFVGSQPFFFSGTNAYWLQSLGDADIDLTFSTMSQNGIKVVRTWAFNDVTQAPQGLQYFQILANGTQTINDGASGLQRLDSVVNTAKKYGIRLILTLTNNWTSKPNPNIPPLTLSNDFGGMDLYVDAFSPGGTHDEFYTNGKIISAFKNYIQHVVSRYCTDPTVMAWEIANDPRCGSSTQPSSSCNTHTITSWVNEISGYIKSIDSKHLITAGDGGFYCLSCPKLYSPLPPTPPSSGSALDGSFGIDTEDILAIPCIDFGSFQLFPDQADYGTFTPQTSFLINSIATGSEWIGSHVATGTSLGKPVSLLAYGLVLKDNFSQFVPVNASTSSTNFLHGSTGGVSADEGNYAQVAWATSGFNGAIGGLLNYQWTQEGLSGASALSRRQTNTTQASGRTSPNDGYTNGPYSTNQVTSQAQAANNFVLQT